MSGIIVRKEGRNSGGEGGRREETGKCECRGGGKKKVEGEMGRKKKDEE